MMKESKRSKIIKLLKQSTTENEHEALNAIRMANDFLKKEDLHWDEFFGGAPVYSRKEKNLEKRNDELKRENKKLREEHSILVNSFRRKTETINNLFNDIRTLKKKLEENNTEKINSPHINMSPNISPFDISERVDNPQVRAKIEVCLKAMPYSSFLHSLDKFWDKNGYLTPNQVKSLDNIYFNL